LIKISANRNRAKSKLIGSIHFPEGDWTFKSRLLRRTEDEKLPCVVEFARIPRVKLEFWGTPLPSSHWFSIEDALVLQSLMAEFAISF
jgi:hypothetical protein